MVSAFGFGNIGSGKGALLSVFPYINHLLNLKKAFVMIFFFFSYLDGLEDQGFSKD